MAEPLTIHYGNGPVRTDHDRTGLPADCTCPAIRWCGQPPHIHRPASDCPHHGYRRPVTVASVRQLKPLARAWAVDALEQDLLGGCGICDTDEIELCGACAHCRCYRHDNCIPAAGGGERRG